MQGSGGLLLIVVALLVIYAGITGKFQCFSGAFRCMFQGGTAPGASSTGGVPGAGGLNPLNPQFPEYKGANPPLVPMTGNAGQLLGINFGIGGYQTPPFV